MIEIKLSEHDALVLRAIMACIGGDPTGPRGAADRLDRALHEAGVPSMRCGSHPTKVPGDLEPDEPYLVARGSVTLGDRIEVGPPARSETRAAAYFRKHVLGDDA